MPADGRRPPPDGGAEGDEKSLQMPTPLSTASTASLFIDAKLPMLRELSLTSALLSDDALMQASDAVCGHTHHGESLAGAVGRPRTAHAFRESRTASPVGGTAIRRLGLGQYGREGEHDAQWGSALRGSTSPPPPAAARLGSSAALATPHASAEQADNTLLEGRTSPPPPLFVFDDGIMFLTYAAHALAGDEFSECFEPKPTIMPQNALLYAIHLGGMAIRYGILFPIRVTLMVLFSAAFVACLALVLFLFGGQEGERIYWMRLLYGTFIRGWLFCFSAFIRHHGAKPDPREPHLFVANHTSFIDFFLISGHGAPHATVAQTHGGLFGILQQYVLSLNGSLFFNRNEGKDRIAVREKMQKHINRRPQVAPLIIFPEGTCVNNESTVLFHKGAFELDALICPIAIKYNKRLSDPYWNTREQTFSQHILYILTRWILVADVWWLPPQQRAPGESAIDFANRVKGLISDTAGLRNLSWDGYMKNCMRSKDQEKMLRSTQEKYVSSLRRRLTPVQHAGLSSSSVVTSKAALLEERMGDDARPDDDRGLAGRRMEEAPLSMGSECKASRGDRTVPLLDCTPLQESPPVPIPAKEGKPGASLAKGSRARDGVPQSLPNGGAASRWRGSGVPRPLAAYGMESTMGVLAAIRDEGEERSGGEGRSLAEPYLPAWLSDAAIVNIKNELLMAARAPFSLQAPEGPFLMRPPPLLSAAAVAARPAGNVVEQKHDVIDTWRHYSRGNRKAAAVFSPPPQPATPEEPARDEEVPGGDAYAARVTGIRIENCTWRLWSKERSRTKEEATTVAAEIEDSEGLSPLMMGEKDQSGGECFSME